jgi:hypothetical protein
VLISVFVEGVAMFRALAYVGADLHQRFGLGLGVVGALLASFGAGALIFSVTAGRMVAMLGQPGLAAFGSIALAAGYTTLAVCRGLARHSHSLRRPRLLCTTRADQRHADGPRGAGLAMSLFAFMLFSGQSFGVALGAPSWSLWRPADLLSAAVIVIAVAFWFRRQLVRRMEQP